MSSDKWPTWPDDQLTLIDLGSSPPPDKTVMTRSTSDKKKDRPTHLPCRKCGEPKRIGFPCEPCEEQRRSSSVDLRPVDSETQS
jgi:hypothetical protein